uniref:Uncharacterized protein n=1 Tax=Leersia perrieri TaxID=77586 RepID=A0A0D9VVB3_9ORYZ
MACTVAAAVPPSMRQRRWCTHGRASSSRSWIEDKIARSGDLLPVAAPSPGEWRVPSAGQPRGEGRVPFTGQPGRATLSNSWVKDKESSQLPSRSRKRSPSPAPLDQRMEKRARSPESEDSEEEDFSNYFAGSSAAISPDPSELPIFFLYSNYHIEGNWHKARKAQEVLKSNIANLQYIWYAVCTGISIYTQHSTLQWC